MLTLALDSGAHSLFHKFMMPKTGGGVSGENINVQARIYTQIDSSYYRSPAFKKYFDEYVKFCHANLKQFKFVVTIDAIFDPKLSYETTMELVKQGLTPIPVLHPGEDYSWLKKYLDKFDYVGLGGLGQFFSKPKYLTWADAAFKMMCDAKGRPNVRVHGFAMASYSLMARWPWTSVDASSAFVHSRNGAILLPKPVIKHGKHEGWDFSGQPRPVWMTKRREHASGSYWHQTPRVQAMVQQYLAELGVEVDQVAEEYVYRDYANLFCIYKVEQAVQAQNAERFGPDWRFNFFISGKPSQTEELFLQCLPMLKEIGIPEVKYLGTFWLPKPIKKFMEHKGG